MEGFVREGRGCCPPAGPVQVEEDVEVALKSLGLARQPERKPMASREPTLPRPNLLAEVCAPRGQVVVPAAPARRERRACLAPDEVSRQPLVPLRPAGELLAEQDFRLEFG